jgi:class 3 adenylate cyclase
MRATNSKYEVTKSDDRIQEILNDSANFDKVNEVPSEHRLTYSNGFYVNCTAVFIDIRGSSSLPQIQKKPVLGKIYRSYISECVAVLNGDSNCREIFINGDCVNGIMNTPRKSDIDTAFSTSAKLNSLIKILNWRYEKKGYTAIECGVGIAYGRALMMQAGYKGSGINDVIWMGDVVNDSSNLCHQGNKVLRQSVQVSTTIYQNLNNHNKSLLKPVCLKGLYLPDQYEGEIIDVEMDNWLNEKKKNTTNAGLLALALSSNSAYYPNRYI